MVKFVMCLTRHPDMIRVQFQDYWLNSHELFFQKNAGVMNSKKYVQSHTMNTTLNEQLRESRGMQPAYDGVAEVWFDSEEDFMKAMSTSEGQKLGAELHADESKFIDHTKSTAFFVEEHEL